MSSRGVPLARKARGNFPRCSPLNPAREQVTMHLRCLQGRKLVTMRFAKMNSVLTSTIFSTTSVIHSYERKLSAGLA